MSIETSAARDNSAVLRLSFEASRARSARQAAPVRHAAAWLEATIRFLPRALVGLALPAALLALWSLAVHAELFAPQILPAPSLVWATTLDLLLSGDLLMHLGVSFARVAIGLFCGGILGLAFGMAFGLSRTFETYVAPTVRAIFLVPSLGWLPFFMLLFGIGESLKIILIAKTCFLPLMINVFGAIRAMPTKYDDVARALELDRWARFRFVILPAVLPAIATGFRQALGKGWKALILVEMISSSAGIGYLMMWGRKSFQLDVVFATMIVVGLVGLAFDRGVLFLQQRATGWSFHAAS